MVLGAMPGSARPQRRAGFVIFVDEPVLDGLCGELRSTDAEVPPGALLEPADGVTEAQVAESLIIDPDAPDARAC